jgi:cytochrome P450
MFELPSGKPALRDAMYGRIELCRLEDLPRLIVQRPFELAGATHRPPVYLVGCIYLMQHEPDLYPEPQTFRPERFLDVSPRPEVWLPWGGGRKRCLGHHFAMLEMRSVLRIVLADLNVVPVGQAIEAARWRSVIVTPRDGSRIVLRRRRRQREPVPS